MESSESLRRVRRVRRAEAAAWTQAMTGKDYLAPHLVCRWAVFSDLDSHLKGDNAAVTIGAEVAFECCVALA